MKILAFAASNHKASINRELVDYSAKRFHAMHHDAQFEFVDLNDYEMPIYSVDRELAQGVPTPAKTFFEKIGSCDALIVSFAEYNGFVTSAWKNTFDWMSRIDMEVWQDKPVVLLAATPGPRAGENVLKSQLESAPFFGMDVKGAYGVGTWPEAWDGTKLTVEKDVSGVDTALKGLLS